MTLQELTERAGIIHGINRLITIAYQAESPKQAADIARRMGLTEEKVKAVRFASIIKRDHGMDKFNEIFQPYELQTLPLNVLSKLTIRLSITDTNKRAEDFLNALELEYVRAKIEELLKTLGVNGEFNTHPPASKWMGNRITKEYSEGQ